MMDDANRAMCFALRNPPRGEKPLRFCAIRKIVRKTDGKRPGISAIQKAASTYKDKKGQRGRPAGSTVTTKAEDRKILQTFHKMRPPGHGVDSRTVHTALPKKLQKKVARRTVIRRLAAKGFVPQRKLSKSDPGAKQKSKRVGFCRRHQDKDFNQWKAHVQGVADMKDFTFYPKELQSRFQKLRAPWTYMTNKEKKKGPFLRPKRWFPKKDWKKTKKQKVFGMTTSNGKKLTFLVPRPWTGEQWAVAVRTRVAPFLRRSFPSKDSFQILLDGEPLLHKPVAKAAMKAANITVLPQWPKYSPDLNPQEHVWSWAETHLRDELETGSDSFETFQKNVVKAVNAYPSSSKLVGSMARKCKELLERSGAMLYD